MSQNYKINENLFYNFSNIFQKNCELLLVIVLFIYIYIFDIVCQLAKKQTQNF